MKRYIITIILIFSGLVLSTLPQVHDFLRKTGVNAVAAIDKAKGMVDKGQPSEAQAPGAPRSDAKVGGTGQQQEISPETVASGTNGMSDGSNSGNQTRNVTTGTATTVGQSVNNDRTQVSKAEETARILRETIATARKARTQSN